MTIFEHWNNLTKNKVLPVFEEDYAGYEPFQINKLLSSINLFAEVAATLSRYDLPKDVHYRYLYNKLAKTDLRVSYPKAKEQNDDETYVAKYFEFGTRDTKDAMKILSKEDVKNIKKKFGKIS